MKPQRRACNLCYIACVCVCVCVCVRVCMRVTCCMIQSACSNPRRHGRAAARLHPVQPQRAAEPRAGDRCALDLQVVVERDNRNTSAQQRAQQRLKPLWARGAPTVTPLAWQQRSARAAEGGCSRGARGAFILIVIKARESGGRPSQFSLSFVTISMTGRREPCARCGRRG